MSSGELPGGKQGVAGLRRRSVGRCVSLDRVGVEASAPWGGALYWVAGETEEGSPSLPPPDRRLDCGKVLRDLDLLTRGRVGRTERVNLPIRGAAGPAVARRPGRVLTRASLAR